MSKVQAVTVKQERNKWWNKETKTASINFALAGVAVFIFDFWFSMVSGLDIWHMLGNYGVVLFGGATLFVGKTFYGKGTINNGKKILYTTLLAIATVALILYTGSTLNIMYPLSGVILTFILFYMISLSAQTLTLVGIIASSVVLATGIGYLKMKGIVTEWDTVGTLAEWSIFIILFFGGVWPHIRRSWHGVQGVNKDGGGFGAQDSEGGDEGDGDGDTGDES